MNLFRRNLLIATLAACGAGAVLAQAGPRVLVTGAWIPPSQPGDKTAVVNMKLKARLPMRLVGVTSTVAGTAELRDTRAPKGRALASVDLPEGRVVELKQGANAIVLSDLKGPLIAGDMVPLTLMFLDKAGTDVRLEFQVRVSLAAPGR